MTKHKASTVRLNVKDNVVVALEGLDPGEPIPAANILTRDGIPPGHKVATETIGKGEYVYKYGQIIGVAVTEIQPGQHVHTHNLGVQEFARDYAFGVDTQPVTFIPEAERRTLRIGDTTVTS